jgi:hypothetical protein
MNNNGFEIERKFLIAMPEEDFLAGPARGEGDAEIGEKT